VKLFSNGASLKSVTRSLEIYLFGLRVSESLIVGESKEQSTVNKTKHEVITYLFRSFPTASIP